MTGATAGKTGRLRSKSDFLLNQRVAHIKLVSKFNDFLAIYVLNTKFQRELFALADGAAQPNMSGGQIESIPILIPNNAIFNSFSKLIAPIVECVDTLYFSNQNLRTTRDLLLPKLISP